MKGAGVIFSSARKKEKGGNDNWQTPWWFLALIRQLGILAFDACTTAANPTGALQFCTPTEDGLKNTWARQGLCFVNPPYSRIRAWIAKCAAEAALGSTVIALIPSRTDTRAFHAECETAQRFAFLRGRLVFVDVRPDRAPVDEPAPFPSLVVLWSADPALVAAFDALFAPHAKIMVESPQVILARLEATRSLNAQ